ncbi:hypothetical protein MSSIH_2568 [Methanosarcina siciliae HI350]|uniref:Uncharacterized protein n=2 Tax=Methanosarcina siciliae TaxID=38027 RepID=A0A0E3PF52_9EURY|nr:hypothetical protein MSSIH_2568 [Methanosarcina siciliae HI350]
MASFNYQEYTDENPDFYNGIVDLLAQLLIHYDLEEVYYENRVKAHKLLNQKNRDEKLPFDKRILVIIEFEREHKKILENVMCVNENNDEEMLILLIHIIRFFERIVNEHICFELENRGFTQSETKTILHKFNIDEKMGWFLKILSGKDYTQTSSNNWSLIKNYIITRNFYIHYAPATFSVYDGHKKKLNKKDFKSVLEAISDCYCFLIECRSKDIKDQYERIENLKKYIKEQDIKDRKEQYEELMILKKRISCLKNNVEELDIKYPNDQYEEANDIEKQVDNLLSKFKESNSQHDNLEGS